MAYASSTDCVGPISKSLEDIRILLNTMSGRDSRDQTTVSSSPIPAEIFSQAYPVDKTTIGYYKSFVENDGLDTAMKEDFLRFIETLKQQGLKVRELDFFDQSNSKIRIDLSFFSFSPGKADHVRTRINAHNYTIRTLSLLRFNGKASSTTSYIQDDCSGFDIN